MTRTPTPTAARRSRRAFTLLELIATLVVIGLLAAIAVPTYRGIVDGAAERTERAEIEGVLRAAVAAAALERRTPSFADVAAVLTDSAVLRNARTDSEPTLYTQAAFDANVADLDPAQRPVVFSSEHGRAALVTVSAARPDRCLVGTAAGNAVRSELVDPYAAGLGTEVPLTVACDTGAVPALPESPSTTTTSPPAPAGTPSLLGVGRLTHAGGAATTTALTELNFTDIAAGTVTDIAAGSSGGCLVASGAAKCWGSGAQGQLGDGGTTASPTPVQVTGLTSGVTKVVNGHQNSCAIHNGAAKCWGTNSSDLLGNPEFTGSSSATPVQVAGLTSGVTGIANHQFHSCAIHNGAAKCWGRGRYSATENGMLGDGSTADAAAPVQVVGLTSGVTAISVGHKHSCAIHNGAAKCWGTNTNGRLGDATTTLSTLPVQVVGLTSGVTAITAGNGFSCAIHHGVLKCWGSIGSTTFASPAPMPGFDAPTSIDANPANHLCAIDSGAVRCLGYNANGQLGTGNTADTVAAGTPIAAGAHRVEVGASFTIILRYT